MGTGKEGTNDGTGGTCTFAQVHGICCLQNTIFVSDVGAGMVKTVSPLTGTVSFLQTLGKLYDSFGIGAQTVDALSLSLQDAVNNVSSVNEYIKSTVATIKQHYNMKEEAATNGPEGTVSKKTQVSLELLEQGIARLQNNLKSVYEDYLGDLDLRTLRILATMVENLHGVSHFKNETFTALQYARDFGTIQCKIIIKKNDKVERQILWHDKSFHPVPTSSIELEDVEVIKPPTAARIDPPIEVAMTNIVLCGREHAVRSETTKDKAGGLPPAVYYTQSPHSKVMFHDDSTVMEQIMPQVTDDDGDSHVPSITFVDDSTVEIVAVGKVPDQEDEYDTDSSSHMDDDDRDSYLHATTLTRSGRSIRAHFRLDL